MAPTAIIEAYRLARAAQDARFDARPGAGGVDHTCVDSEEYREFFGLGEFHGYGVETRVTYKSFLIAYAAERRAEREAAEQEARRELAAQTPTAWLLPLADRSDIVAAELDARLAEWDAAHEHEPEFDVDAELAALVDDAPKLDARITRKDLRRVYTPCNVVRVSKSTVTKGPTMTAQPAAPQIAETDVPDVDLPAPVAANREAWLTNAVEALRLVFVEQARRDIPAVRVSVGWPGGRSPAKVIGQCWPSAVAADKAAQVFISPALGDAADVLGVLVHELIHAVDDCASGHKGAFTKMARALGLEGKMTATTVGETLKATLADIAEKLGEYPHAALSPAAAGVKKQGTRMLKVECPECGYTLRTTAKWLEVGVPTCPCGTEMLAA